MMSGGKTNSIRLGHVLKLYNDTFTKLLAGEKLISLQFLTTGNIKIDIDNI